MHHDPRVLLTDIDQAGADIESFTEGMDSAAYVDDVRTQSAVERKFEIIGEALNRLHKDHPDLTARNPGLRVMIDLRNLLAHGYDHVAPKRVWDYARTNLPHLRRVIQRLIAELEPPGERAPLFG